MPTPTRRLGDALTALAGLVERRPGPNVPRLALTCYTRPGCTLCEKAKRPIAGAVRGLPVMVEWVDIAGDPALLARWDERIPVVLAGDTVLAEGKVSELWLRRALERHLSDARQEGRRDGH